MFNTHLRDGLKELDDKIGLDLWQTNIKNDDGADDIKPQYTVSRDPNLQAKSFGLLTAKKSFTESQNQRAKTIFELLTKSAKAPPGNSATLLKYMFGERDGVPGRFAPIDENNAEMPKDLAEQRGGNDSPSNIYRELKPLERSGLVEGKRRGPRYLSEKALRLGAEKIIEANPELNLPDLHKRKQDMKKVAARVEKEDAKQIRYEEEAIRIRDEKEASRIRDEVVERLVEPVKAAFNRKEYKEAITKANHVFWLHCAFNLDDTVGEERKQKINDALDQLDPAGSVKRSSVTGEAAEIAFYELESMRDEAGRLVKQAALAALHAPGTVEIVGGWKKDIDTISWSLFEENTLVEGWDIEEEGITGRVKTHNLYLQSLTPEARARISTGDILLLGPGRHIYEILMLLRLFPYASSLHVVDQDRLNLSHIKKELDKRDDIDKTKIKLHHTDLAHLSEEFGNDRFDFCFSNAVFDRSLDYENPTFKQTLSEWCAELKRVRKPDGIYLSDKSDVEFFEKEHFVIRNRGLAEFIASTTEKVFAELTLQEAFGMLSATAEKSELKLDLSRFQGVCQRMTDASKFRFCVPVEVLKNSADFMIALQKLDVYSWVPFELIITGVTEEDIDAVIGLNETGIKKALRFVNKITVSMITEGQIQERAEWMGIDGTDAKIRTEIVKQLSLESQPLTQGEYMAIATDAVKENDAQMLEDGLRTELQDNISIRVMVSPETGKSVFALSAILNDWLKDIRNGNKSTIQRILPRIIYSTEMIQRLESRVRTAWRVLAAA